MPDTFLGVVTAHDMDGTTSWTGKAAGVTDNMQSANLTETADVGEVKNGANTVISVNISNSQRECTIEAIPTHATDASTVVLPAVGTVLTLAGLSPATINGDWNVASGASFATDNGPDGATKMTIPLKQYVSDDKLDAV